MTLNSTNWTAMTDFEGILLEANRFAEFWLGILLMMWVVLVVTFLPFGTHVAVLGGSFLALVLGIFLYYMGLVAGIYVLMMMGMILVIVIIDAIFSRKET
jgi:hypothetical protein